MIEFSFINDETLRTMIERDKNELDKCLEQKLAKATMVLAGSIIEAVLTDYFLSYPPDGKSAADILHADLFNLVEWGVQSTLLGVRHKDLSTVIRGYRNLIHPGKEYRLKEKCDYESAVVAASLVNMIVKDIATNYAAKLGYTAEQALEKVTIDPQCAPIFSDMVSSMSPVERTKLFRLIPERCWTNQDMPETTIRIFELLHSILSKQVTTETLKAEAMKAYTYVQTKGKEETLFYLRFYGDHIGLLEDTQRDTVVNYLLGVAAREHHDPLWQYQTWGVFRSIGQCLNSADGAAKLIKSLEDHFSNTASESDAMFFGVVEDIHNHLDEERKKALMEWGESQPLWKRRATQLADLIKSGFPPPF